MVVISLAHIQLNRLIHLNTIKHEKHKHSVFNTTVVSPIMKRDNIVFNINRTNNGFFIMNLLKGLLSNNVQKYSWSTTNYNLIMVSHEQYDMICELKV